MLMVLTFLVVDIDGNLSRYYRRYINIWDDIAIHRALIIIFSFIVLIIDGIDTSTTAIVSMSLSQPITSMALSADDFDTIDDVSMADPWPYREATPSHGARNPLPLLHGCVYCSIPGVGVGLQ
jgi:hypothetical protein